MPTLSQLQGVVCMCVWLCSLTLDKAKAIPQLKYRINTPDWSQDYAPLVAKGAVYGQQYAIWRSQQANPRYLVEFERRRRRPMAGAAAASGSSGGNGGSGDSGDGDHIEWQTAGHEWIGHRLLRVFERRSIGATVTRWAPEDGDDPALWHVEHDDGDEEDLEHHEVEKALAAAYARPLAAPGAAMATKSRGKGKAMAPNAAAMAAADPPLFSVGLVGDVQYADMDDGTNHDGTMVRRYRSALATLGRAVDWWCSLPTPPAFIAQLGDMLDRANADFGVSESALEAVLAQLRRAPCLSVNVIGNHELYNFGRAALANAPWLRHGDREFYTFQPADGWRVLVLDSYQEALLGLDEADPRYQQAVRTLRQSNPKALTPDGWFADVTGADRRFTPLNGALGAEQRKWLAAALEDASAASERVLILSHVVLHPQACDGACMLWDYEETLTIIHDSGCVAAVVCGHDHTGGCACSRAQRAPSRMPV